MSEETSRRNKGRERGRAKRKISSVIDVSPVTLFYYPRETGGRRGMINEREREVRDNRRFLRFLDKHRHTAHYYTVVERRKQLFSPPPSELCAQVTRAAETRGN